MRRIVLLLLVAVTMVTAMVPAGAVFAESLSDPSDNGNPSCFGAYARSEPAPPPGPGGVVSDAATGLAMTGPESPGSGTDEVANNIGAVQRVRPCPTDYPLQQ
jgi:hypothetical protein